VLMGIDFNRYLEEQKPYLTKSQIVELLNYGFTFGGHSRDHARFAELTLEEQKDQVKVSIDYLINEFSVEYRVFAFPYSDAGVKNVFFDSLNDYLDASFGTHGLKRDPVPNHFQRISVEKYLQKARKTVKYHLSRQIIQHILGKDYIIRK